MLGYSNGKCLNDYSMYECAPKTNQTLENRLFKLN